MQVCGTQFAYDLASWNTPRTDRQLTVLAKAGMVGFIVEASVLAYLTFDYPRLQLLAQISYLGIIQLAVPLCVGIFSRRSNKEGAIGGMLAGIVVATLLTTLYPDDIPALGALTRGTVGLVMNAAIFCKRSINRTYRMAGV